ncbi:hypothetical protein BBAD15_g9232 [Beauveria bassiana D1-5]|uniref:Uncharacterized protein n=1 Tax=Beauveria bassiana D1-5 TaxID=1245745 RepID=A0A0A2VH60_BEABA|nr:hypothetical protein BBAD15_g9232 [Beauveria bassiana D1-5]
MAGPRASSGLLRNRIRRQSSMTPPSVSPTTTEIPVGGGPAVPKVRLERLDEERLLMPGPDASSASNGAAHAASVQAR